MKAFELQEYHIDWIEDFLLDRLNEQELRHFQEMLAHNPTLQQELEVQQEIFDGLKDLGHSWSEAYSDAQPHQATDGMPFRKILAMTVFLLLGFLSLRVYDQLTQAQVQLAQPSQSLKVENNELLPLMHHGDLGYDGLYWMIQNNIHLNWKSNHPYESFYAQRV